MRKYTFCFFLASFLLLSACSLYNLEKKLDPEGKEFLSKVRFIVTKQERKIFLNLPPEEREGFIEEFWRKRDPDPGTEINEYREEYFNRIEEADHLFTEGTTPGWLQDRGRIYITLGPPDHRQVYPRGITQYGIPTEIWHYGFFTMVFIDEAWTGTYKLDPYSAQHIGEINRAQVDWQPSVAKDKVVFDLAVRISKGPEGQVTFRFEIPYRNIWFAEKDNSLETTIHISLQVLDQAEEEVWQYQENQLISLTEEKFEELISKKHIIDIASKFEPGEYYLITEIENKTDGKRVRKTAKFSR